MFLSYIYTFPNGISRTHSLYHMPECEHLCYKDSSSSSIHWTEGISEIKNKSFIGFLKKYHLNDILKDEQ